MFTFECRLDDVMTANVNHSNEWFTFDGSCKTNLTFGVIVETLNDGNRGGERWEGEFFFTFLSVTLHTQTC